MAGIHFGTGGLSISVPACMAHAGSCDFFVAPYRENSQYFCENSQYFRKNSWYFRKNSWYFCFSSGWVRVKALLQCWQREGEKLRRVGGRLQGKSRIRRRAPDTEGPAGMPLRPSLPGERRGGCGWLFRRVRLPPDFFIRNPFVSWRGFSLCIQGEIPPCISGRWWRNVRVRRSPAGRRCL